MKTPPPAAINAIYGPVEANASITQIYAVNARELEASVFVSRPQTTMFSPEWLLFHEEKAPLMGREAELKALRAFAGHHEYFRWWSMHGPAGIGKSRLAHAFLRELADTWSGGFLAPDRTTIGGATAWEPQSDTFWVIDYAAAHTGILSNFLCTLARRFANGPYKVRVLLLEREASQTSVWWRNLIQQAGSGAAAMEGTLQAPSLLLEPLAQQTGALLEELLRRGPIGAVVDDVQVVRMAATGSLTGFAVRSGGHRGTNLARRPPAARCSGAPADRRS